MGRPSKHKAIVEKFFVKTRPKGKSDFHTCIFCNKCYAFNSCRLVKHLLACTHTGAEFVAEKERIKSLLLSPKSGAVKRPAQRNLNNGRSAACASPGQGTFTPAHSCNDNGRVLTSECQNLTSNANDSFRFTESCNVGSFAPVLNTNFNDNRSNTSLVSTKFFSTTTESNYTSKHLSTNSSDPYNHHPTCSSPEEKEVWKTLARACYASGTLLSFTENVYWSDVFKKIQPELKLPTRYHLSNSLLDAEYQRIEDMVLKKINNAQFLSLQLGGWYYIRLKPIVNIIIMTPEPVIYKLVDTSNNANSEECMINIIENVFNAFSNKKIISVVTDDAQDMTCSWRILKDKFGGQNISYYGCATHMLNLVIKDIMQLEIFALLGNSAVKICEEFEDSPVLSSLLRKFQNNETDGIHEKKLALILPNVALMNWVSYVQCLKSLIFNKEHLKQIANSSKAINGLSRISLLKILDCHHTFLPKIEELMKILEPISLWIKTLELKTSNLSDVICAFYEIKVAVNELFSVSTELVAEKQNVLSILENRKKMATEHIHFAAHLLDPRYKGKYLTKEEGVDATQFILSLAKHLEIDEIDVLSDIADFRTNGGLWSKNFVWDCLNIKSEGTEGMDPLIWWNEVCSSSSLATVASAIMQCPPTSASQRTFSTYGLIHVEKKYELSDDKASKLIYIKHNLKLQESKDFDILDTDNVNNLSTIKQELSSDTEPDYDDFLDC